MKKSDGIDFMKAVMAVCIVGIHTQVLNIFPEQIDWYITHMVFRLGVPFFFVVSGFFFGKKLSVCKSFTDRLSVAKNYIAANVVPFVFWGSVALLWEMWLGIKKQGVMGIVEVIHDSIFYPFGAMWFLLACMIAALFIAVLYNHKKVLYIIAIAGYFFALICNSYYWVIADTFVKDFVDVYIEYFVSARNGLFVGVMQFGCGVWLYTHKKLQKFSNIKIYCSTVVAYLLLGAEVTLCYGRHVRDDSSLFVIMPVLSILLLESCIRMKIPCSLQNSLKLRTFSKQLFYLHPFFNMYMGYELFQSTKNGLIQFVYVCACCLVTMFITKKIDNPYVKKVLPN